MQVNNRNKVVIVQGRITPWTEQSLKFFESLPNTHVIFSTWKDQDRDIDTNAQVLYLEDPGPGPIQNFNRQVYGLTEALRLCEDDDLVLKTRSDMVHARDPFEIFKDIPVEQNGYDVLRSKLYISNIMTIDAYKKVPGEGHRFFNPSDWLFLGNAYDIKEWADVQRNSNYVFAMAKVPSPHPSPTGHCCCEQLWCLSNAIKSEKAYSDIDFSDLTSLTNQQVSDVFIKTNFEITNTISTLNALCGRYSHQPEDLEFYMRELKSAV
tara:strand:+ start:148 stop:942 length:795 start_codon:yes stop_codon:yes gene_type:complete